MLLSPVQVLDVSCVLEIRAGLHGRVLLGVIMCIIVAGCDAAAVVGAIVTVAAIACIAALVGLRVLSWQ